MQNFGEKVEYPMSRKIMRSRMINGLHVSSQEPSMPSKSLMMTGVFLHTSNHARMLKFGTHIRNPMSRIITRSRMTHVFHVFDQDPSMLSQVSYDDGEVLDTLLIMQES